ncbi:MAG: mannitol dehydrogenase [Clostridiales Family XIII bacterium]|jgi:mannitol-1-phosphate 5-dehydrogenase|nr:mannitol dehydrogenase [Clostridiales Family XIII bacterium]
MRAAIYGAGNIGRGFIGMLLAESGYDVTFVEADQKLVEMLNESGRYPVRTLNEEGGSDIWVEGVSAICASDTDAVVAYLATADIAATAVGARALERVAPLIAEGLSLRYTATEQGAVSPINILICENLPDAGKTLAKWVSDAAPGSRERSLIAENTGFVETSIGRMTPVQSDEMKDGNPLRISAEPYSALPVDADAFKGPIPDIKGMEPHGDFSYYTKRKLYIHNMGHATCAYLGLGKGYRYISEAIRDEGIRYIVEGAMKESAEALSMIYGSGREELMRHVDDLISRFGNRALGDTCERVGVDVTRKLGPSERFEGAVAMCREAGVECPNIEEGMAAARRAAV